VTSREVLRLLEAEGWYRVGQVGSHVQLKHNTRKGRVTVSHPRKDVKIEDLISIERQSGVRLRRR
jgi:predicted RNA binding protein YcfA (HicA-like mRNA interferase family)